MATASPDPNGLLALYAQLEAEVEPPQERRLHPRTPAKSHVPATLELTPGAPPIAVAIRDMSRSGIGLSAPCPVAVGAAVVVRFCLKTGPVQATCHVANCREDDSGRYIIGLALTEVRKPQPPAATPPAPPSSPPPMMTAPDGPEGVILSAHEAMTGAELAVVSEVVQRLARAIAQS
jgi:hypothetical protein